MSEEKIKILTICPSIYPHKLEKMLNSYDVTRSKYNQLVIDSRRGSITKIINDLFQKYNDFDFYHITNDDVIYETPLWDIKLAVKGKISYGDDMFQSEYLCTFPMIDGKIARAVGWLQQPTLERYYGDSTWKFIGEQLGILNYDASVINRHNWEGADIEVYKQDTEKFANWLPMAHKDINKIKEILCQKNIAQ